MKSLVGRTVLALSLIGLVACQPTTPGVQKVSLQKYKIIKFGTDDSPQYGVEDTASTTIWCCATTADAAQAVADMLSGVKKIQ